MKVKWTGDKVVTIRHRRFEPNKPTEVDDILGAKVLGIDGFQEVKPGRKKSDDKDAQ